MGEPEKTFALNKRSTHRRNSTTTSFSNDKSSPSSLNDLHHRIHLIESRKLKHVHSNKKNANFPQQRKNCLYNDKFSTIPHSSFSKILACRWLQTSLLPRKKNSCLSKMEIPMEDFLALNNIVTDDDINLHMAGIVSPPWLERDGETDWPAVIGFIQFLDAIRRLA